MEAWEALKGGHQNVDLILTEVELPSISGFALLTLIMEDDICKKIPVISMRSWVFCFGLRSFAQFWSCIGVQAKQLLIPSHDHAVMSSHDSISVVLKCMLKGAADFLIKPVRKNELRNLWQHVWRRHAVSLICSIFLQENSLRSVLFL